MSPHAATGKLPGVASVTGAVYSATRHATDALMPPLPCAPPKQSLQFGRHELGGCGREHRTHRAAALGIVIPRGVSSMLVQPPEQGWKAESLRARQNTKPDTDCRNGQAPNKQSAGKYCPKTGETKGVSETIQQQIYGTSSIWCVVSA